jgi:hypothetical protein
MKRFLLVLVLSIACFALLATTALASAPRATTQFRLEANTAYVFAYGDGSWFEVTDVANGVFVGHWATYDEDTGEMLIPADPIPANLDIVMQESWKGWTFGLMKKLPTAFEIQLGIPEAGVDISYEEAKAYWNDPHIWDQYWIDAAAFGEIWYAFNPHIGADIYATTWLLPLGQLDQGSYTVEYAERWVKEWTNMDPDFGQTHGGPWHARRGDGGSTSFTFTVGPPRL